jgi:hypothetical protein
MFIVDRRVGCVAVYHSNDSEDTNGCHIDDHRNVFYSVGVREGNSWTINKHQVISAEMVCSLLNDYLRTLKLSKDQLKQLSDLLKVNEAPLQHPIIKEIFDK